MKILFVAASTLAVARFAVAANLVLVPPNAPAQADPASATSSLIYQSPLAGFVPLQEPTVSPSSIWRETNRAVGSYDSMTATMEAMPTEQQKTSLPMQRDKSTSPMGHDMTPQRIKQRPQTQPRPKRHDMKSMPMEHTMPMHMEMK